MADMNDEGCNLVETLEFMDLSGLKKLRRDLDRAIASYETRKRREALLAVEQAAREHGFRLGDLLGEGKSGKRRKSASDKGGTPAKYVNPEDSGQIWGGRGRRPQWVNSALESGRTLEELAT